MQSAPPSVSGKRATLLIVSPVIEYIVSATDYETQNTGTQLYTIVGEWRSKTVFEADDGITYHITDGAPEERTVDCGSEAVVWLTCDGNKVEVIGQIHSIGWETSPETPDENPSTTRLG